MHFVEDAAVPALAPYLQFGPVPAVWPCACEKASATIYCAPDYEHSFWSSFQTDALQVDVGELSGNKQAGKVRVMLSSVPVARI